MTIIDKVIKVLWSIIEWLDDFQKERNGLVEAQGKGNEWDSWDEAYREADT